MSVMRISPRRLHLLLLRWYGSHGRDLPWRRTRDPYRILLSEIMLQQTQVSRVLMLYPKFLRTYPSIRKLASAKPSEVIIAWRGMGYNRRALYLHRCAQAIVEEGGGRFPRDPERLRSLPGIGRYTANAVASSAFRLPLAIVDTNVRRVISRVQGRHLTEEAVWKNAQRLLPVRHAYEWNQALMDLGAMICIAHDPRCAECPLRTVCPSAHRVKRPLTRVVREPGREGVPNRIFRGRIVEYLRQRKRGASSSLIAREVVPSLRPGEMPWFARLIRSLEADGLVRVVRCGRSERVSLAA